MSPIVSVFRLPKVPDEVIRKNRLRLRGFCNVPKVHRNLGIVFEVVGGGSSNLQNFRAT